MRHIIALLGTAAVGLSTLTWGSTARAQEAPYMERTIPAPSNAFELKLGTGYTQGFGNIAPGRSVLDVAGAGIGFSLDLDYRLSPMASVGVETQYQEFTTENNAASRGLATNLGVTVHASPERRGDPWLRLGTGYRFLWDVNPFFTNATVMFHGFDFLTAKVGYDIRPSPDVALAPVIGADLQTFFWANGTALTTAQVATFIYAGLQGRFDAGGSSARTVARNR
jgi:hypothetical protein